MRHLLIDLPSADHETDPALPAHRAFWDGEAGEWELIFNGNLKNIGLTNKTQEKIDGLHVLPEAPEW